MITIEDVHKIEIQAGKIVSAEKIPDTEKLLRLSVDFNEVEHRCIVSGIALHFPDPAVLVGKTYIFITNLLPREIKGVQSNGMILGLKTEEVFSLLEPSQPVSPGTSAQ